MFDFMLIGNPDTCRLEAEISDAERRIVALVFEDSDGWHVEDFGDADRIPQGFLEELKTEMRTYVNRKGEHAPEGWSRGELSLWLMQKKDGTAMGLPSE